MIISLIAAFLEEKELGSTKIFAEDAFAAKGVLPMHSCKDVAAILIRYLIPSFLPCSHSLTQDCAGCRTHIFTKNNAYNLGHSHMSFRSTIADQLPCIQLPCIWVYAVSIFTEQTLKLTFTSRHKGAVSGSQTCTISY